jgi:hypothetical protein
MVKNNKKESAIRWIIKNKNTGEFLNKDSRYFYTKSLKNAMLINSRSKARNNKESDEIVCKVKLENNQIHFVGPEWM